jgi:hypothetical protein
MKKEQHMRLEELGFGDESKYETIKGKCIWFDWICLNRLWPFIFIYRVGRSCNSFYKSNPIRTPWFISDTGAPVRPVKGTGQTGVACRTSYSGQTGQITYTGTSQTSLSTLVGYVPILSVRHGYTLG